MKKGLIVACFGTSFADTRERCIESLVDRFREVFPEYEVRTAFTSNMIIRKLKERDNEIIQTPHEAIQQMMEEDFDAIHVQPLHIIPGFEYEKVACAVRLANHKTSIPISLGNPLLFEEADYDEVVEALLTRLPDFEANKGIVLMGHGTDHYANACYSMLQAKINERRSDIHIANVEGYPELAHVIRRLEPYAAVTLVPLMLVAGDHARNDMAGEDENSYCSILQAKGIEARAVLEGLGENPLIQQAFVHRAEEKLDAARMEEGNDCSHEV